MTISIILTATIIFLCILADRFSNRFGMPALILFMFVGMLFGSDGLLKIPFDNYTLAEQFCSIALIFIMFYGGFNTKWSIARPVAVRAILLSTLGVIITAGITAFLCHICLHFSIAESFLIGAVLSSTDAASVFSILRQKKLNLKDGTASLLEMESGSNDPVSYMLTLIGIGILASSDQSNLGYTIFAQLTYGCLLGVLFALLAIRLLTKTRLIAEGLDTIFMIAIVLLCYGLSSFVGGNAYLSVYLLGILIGNSPIKNKSVLIPFFDGITGLAQIFLFFVLGLLAFPHKFPAILLPSLAIVFFLTILARLIAVFLILKPLKSSLSQCLLVSWAGLRGAASIVFATMVIASGTILDTDLFHIVFMVALFSVSIQGTLLPLIAKKLDMVDDSIDVRKTFNDYQEDSSITLMRMFIPEGHNWQNRPVKDVHMPTGSLAIMIKRNKETIIPKGDTRILAGDNVILSVPSYEPGEQDKLEEIHITAGHTWCNRSIESLQLPSDELIALIIRGDENVIPDGQTIILENDIVVTYH